MYMDTVTLFNRQHTSEGDYWHPTILHNVDLNIDKAAITAKYGAESSDRALLHVKFGMKDGKTVVGGKTWLSPKEWADQAAESQGTTITFADGERFDFFFAGEWEGTGPVSDDDYRDGFYNHMNAAHDYVFAITSVAKYSLIPHFEIVGK